MCGVERSQPGQIENAAKVDEERVGPLTGEHLSATLQRMHGSGTESGLVVRCAPFAHIARGDLERFAEGRRTTLAVRVPVDPGQRERLWSVPVRRVDRGDGAGVVQESLGVANGGR